MNINDEYYFDDAVYALDDLKYGPDQEISFEDEMDPFEAQAVTGVTHTADDDISPPPKRVKFTDTISGDTTMTGSTGDSGCDCKKRYTCEEKCQYNAVMKEKCKGCSRFLRKKRTYRRPYSRRRSYSRSYGRRSYSRKSNYSSRKASGKPKAWFSYNGKAVPFYGNDPNLLNRPKMPVWRQIRGY